MMEIMSRLHAGCLFVIFLECSKKSLSPADVGYSVNSLGFEETHKTVLTEVRYSYGPAAVRRDACFAFLNLLCS